jgi:hypothetical protein
VIQRGIDSIIYHVSSFGLGKFIPISSNIAYPGIEKRGCSNIAYFNVVGSESDTSLGTLVIMCMRLTKLKYIDQPTL